LRVFVRLENHDGKTAWPQDEKCGIKRLSQGKQGRAITLGVEIRNLSIIKPGALQLRYAVDLSLQNTE